MFRRKMKSGLLLVITWWFSGLLLAQQTVSINGYAPKYVGQRVLLNAISDYLTDKETTIATAEVQADSTFRIITYLEETQKVNLYVGKNSSFLYIQPGGDYTIYFPDRDRMDPPRPMGNKVELMFRDLDSNDVNEKIMIFNNSLDNFLKVNYRKSKSDAVEYNRLLDQFKANISAYFAADTGTYVFDYIRFSLASIDNLPQAGNRNRYEKFDFYLKYQPVRYNNDAYMDYFKTFYSGLMNTLPMERNNEVYLGLVKASPTLMMNALGKEVTLTNVRIRELAMIQALGEMYYQKDYPQTNILAVLDSLSNHALFQHHRTIAANMQSRLTEIATGGKAPDFVLTKLDGQKKTLLDYRGKFVYLHFFEPTVEQAAIDFQLLQNLHKKYGTYIEFVTIVPAQAYQTDKAKSILKNMGWDLFIADDFNASIWKDYKVESFPYFVLIDPQGYAVQAPALTPRANALYETIDHTFFEIKKVMDRQLKEKKDR